jgi:spore coat polysaccharide biosynthesis predicted glycosyltransferase SpsG
MKLGFRTRGGPTQGWGNIFRLASFARYCQSLAEVQAVFYAEGPPEVEQYLIGQGFEVVMLPEDITPAQEHVALGGHAPVEVFFAEMLDITPERQQVLRKHAGRLIIFDDLCDHIYNADLVVSGQALPSHANRVLSDPETRFLVGYDYFLCRPEFVPFGQREREYNTCINKVLVTLGGGAYGVGYLKAALGLARWKQQSGSDLEASFVLGFADQGNLREQILAILPNAEVLGGVSDLQERLWECDLVIGSAGYTKLEAALTQTPCLMISVQWHQIPLASSFAERTGTPDLGYMSYVEPEALCEAIEAMGDAEVRADYARRACLAVDGKGFERVHAAVFGEAG